MTHSVPTRRSADLAGPRQAGLKVNPLVIGALACILLYFVGMASLWPFFERIGVGKGLTAGTVAFALSVSAFGGLAGSLVASVVADRLPRVVGLLSGLCLLIAARSEEHTSDLQTLMR